MSIIQNNNEFRFVNTTNTYEKLPALNYALKKDIRGEYYLEQLKNFKLPSKIYGNHSIVDRWLTSWKVNSFKNLGILLNGLKGTGKTITAQKLCIDSGLPVITITEYFCGSDFVSFVTNPALGEYILFIEEFEKIYKSKDNDTTDLLTIMDGIYDTKILFLLTSNEINKNEYLINRLSRIKYKKDYNSLENEVIEEVINDKLKNKEHADSIYKFFEKLGIATFDLLINIINEMNTFGEDALECAKHLNLDYETMYCDVYEEVNGELYKCSDVKFSLNFTEV